MFCGVCEDHQRTMHKNSFPLHSVKHQDVRTLPSFLAFNALMIVIFVSSERCRFVLRDSMAAIALASKKGRVRELVVFLFCGRMVAVVLMKYDRFLQPILESNRWNTVSLIVNIATPILFEFVVFFHGLLILKKRLRKKTRNVPQTRREGTI